MLRIDTVQLDCQSRPWCRPTKVKEKARRSRYEKGDAEKIELFNDRRPGHVLCVALTRVGEVKGHDEYWWNA